MALGDPDTKHGKPLGPRLAWGAFAGLIMILAIAVAAVLYHHPTLSADLWGGTTPRPRGLP